MDVTEGLVEPSRLLPGPPKAAPATPLAKAAGSKEGAAGVQRDRPITPQEAAQQANAPTTTISFPPLAVYDAFNELIVDNLVNGFSRVQCVELHALISVKCGVTHKRASAWAEQVADKAYGGAGWEVHKEAPRGYFDPNGFYYIFASEPVPSNEALRKKHHPNDDMPQFKGL